MCVVSMVMDHYTDEWGRRLPRRPGPYEVPYWPQPLGPQPMTPQELEEEARKFKDLIDRAKEYDRKNNEPDCELDEKRKALKKIADELGIKITFT